MCLICLFKAWRSELCAYECPWTTVYPLLDRTVKCGEPLDDDSIRDGSSQEPGRVVEKARLEVLFSGDATPFG